MPRVLRNEQDLSNSSLFPVVRAVVVLPCGWRREENWLRRDPNGRGSFKNPNHGHRNVRTWRCHARLAADEIQFLKTLDVICRGFELPAHEDLLLQTRHNSQEGKDALKSTKGQKNYVDLFLAFYWRLCEKTERRENQQPKHKLDMNSSDASRIRTCALQEEQIVPHICDSNLSP